MTKVYNRMRLQGSNAGNTAGFTLIELLVVVAIIAMLISILLPSLSQARKQARATTLATNLKHVAQSVTIYLNDNKDVFPPSYLYASDDAGNWELSGQYQNAPHDYGYLHWSYFLYGNGEVNEKSFRCPEIKNGGHSRTNYDESDAAEKTGAAGATPHNQSVLDKQARFIAYTANAAIMGRNKYQGDPNTRTNAWVNVSKVRKSTNTVLATEFSKNPKHLQEGKGPVLIKSHRSVHPFFDQFTGGYKVYEGRPNRTGGFAPFTYGDPGSTAGGLKPLAEWETAKGLISDSGGNNKANCVGRHHPGGKNKEYGGATNFLFVDTHVERSTILETMEKRQWGDRFYTMAGANKVDTTKPIKMP